MKKALVVLAIVGLMVIALPAMASASGWDPLTGGSPHSGFATTTDQCKMCHAVHEADDDAGSLNGVKLLRSDASGACDYCHVQNNFSIKEVYDNDSANYAADTGKEHTLSSGPTTIPDSGDVDGGGLPTGEADPADDYVLTDGLQCTDCHSVHGAGCIAGSKILKADPGPSPRFVPGSLATSTTEFCADCHTNNYVTDKDVGGDQSSHYMGAVTSATADAASTECRSCHSGGAGTAANSFPHMTTGNKFLMDTYTDTNLDRVCLNCHSGIETDY